ncbi:MAG: PGF-CTERM sorting domain-containing protein [Halolamina sp.]
MVNRAQSRQHRTLRRGGTLLIVAMLLLTPAASTGAAHSDGHLPSKPAFVVDLDEDGSARVTVTVTFNLSSDDEQRAFESLRENETARQQRTERFGDRMRAIAATTQNETGREMTVRDAAIEFVEQNGTGIVALSVTWEGLAAQTDEGLVLREPFNSGFDINRTFRVVGPQGYTLAAVTPEPADRSENAATWGPSAGFDGFRAVFAPTTTEADASGTTGTNGPGFGIVAGVLALLTGVAGVLRRTRQ